MRLVGWVFGAALMVGIVVSGAGEQGNPFRRERPVVVYTQSVEVGGSALQVDFTAGALDLPRSEIIERIRTAATAVARFYGRFPVPRALIQVMPVEGEDGVLQGTTWGDMAGFPAFLKLRVGQHTTHEELATDWVITHELVHTALPSLPDDEHWLEEGIASYIEPIARAQAGQLATERVWHEMVGGMPNGEPGPRDKGLNATHTWGRTYWGGALFCLVADIEIRKETGNRKGLKDALRGIVEGGGSIDEDWSAEKTLKLGDQATGTEVLTRMYTEWSKTAVSVDLGKLWSELGVSEEGGGMKLNSSSPMAAARVSITASGSR